MNMIFFMLNEYKIHLISKIQIYFKYLMLSLFVLNNCRILWEMLRGFININRQFSLFENIHIYIQYNKIARMDLHEEYFYEFIKVNINIFNIKL